MTHALTTLLARWRQATAPEAIFSDLATMSLTTLKQQYHLLAAVVHPDHHQNCPDATAAFRLLQQWYALAQQQVTQRVNGVAPLVITTAKARYVSTETPLPGDLCDLYPATADQQLVLLKVVRSAHNNDLMQWEAQVLQRLARTLAGQAVRAHFPTLIEPLQLRDVAGVQRQVNVLAYENDYVTLAEIMRCYPAGIDAADAAWIFNRILAALGVIHQLDLVHGAVTPDHVLVRLHDHNGLLVDWCYSVPMGEPLKAMNLAYRADYPPEVPARQPATAATDLYMAACCMVRLLGGDPATGAVPDRVPQAIQRLLRSCLLPAPHRRANDAWELFDEFHTRLGQLYGPPRFRPFHLPV